MRQICGSLTSIAAAGRRWERGALVAPSHRRGALPFTAVLPHRRSPSVSIHPLLSPPRRPTLPPLPRTFMCVPSPPLSPLLPSRPLQPAPPPRRPPRRLNTTAFVLYAIAPAKCHKEGAKTVRDANRWAGRDTQEQAFHPHLQPVSSLHSTRRHPCCHPPSLEPPPAHGSVISVVALTALPHASRHFHL